jgi:hypothetical protein
MLRIIAWLLSCWAFGCRQSAVDCIVPFGFKYFNILYYFVTLSAVEGLFCALPFDSAQGDKRVRSDCDKLFVRSG